MIKTILWDIDDTLLDFKMAEKHSFKRTFLHFGLGKCNDETVDVYSGINQRHWEQLERGEITKQQVLQNRFTDFFAVMNINNVSEAEFCEYYENGLSDKIYFKENSFEIVKALKGSVNQYAVTNGAENIQLERLRKSGFSSLLDGAFISDKIGYEKPSRQFFNEVLNNIIPCKKQEILIVGDSLTSDMLGGVNAGIKTCWYNPNHKNKPDNLDIDYEIDELNSIFEIIKAP